jgi:hypothetical protein
LMKRKGRVRRRRFRGGPSAFGGCPAFATAHGCTSR